MPTDPRPAVAFLGDLRDPWVASIAAAIPGPVRRVSAAGELPVSWPEEVAAYGLVVLHRAIPTRREAEGLARLKARGDGGPQVVLCVGPLARYQRVESLARLCEAILPEATAAETVGRYARPAPPRPDGPRPRVAIVSPDFALRGLLAEVCQVAGYQPVTARALDEAPSGMAAVWDVPVLDHGWAAVLGRESRHRPIVALAGFCDRGLVRQLRDAGASACLDLPCEPADLAWVLDRVLGEGAAPTPRADGRHVLPPAPGLIRRAQGNPNGLDGQAAAPHLQ
jgi:hypothetical protein